MKTNITFFCYLKHVPTSGKKSVKTLWLKSHKKNGLLYIVDVYNVNKNAVNCKLNIEIVLFVGVDLLYNINKNDPNSVSAFMKFNWKIICFYYFSSSVPKWTGFRYWIFWFCRCLGTYTYTIALKTLISDYIYAFNWKEKKMVSDSSSDITHHCSVV